MKIFRNVFKRTPATPSPHVDVLWAEISSAIGSAGIHVRSADDAPPIIDVPGFHGFKYEKLEPRRFFQESFPAITSEQLARALRYLGSRVIDQRRHEFDVQARAAQPDGKAWRDWSPRR